MANKNYVRVSAGVVIEVISTTIDINDLFHPSIASQFLAAPKQVVQGWTYDGKSFSAPVPPTPEPVDLTAYTANKRWQVETGGITIDGMPITTDRESQAMISSAFQVASVTGQAIKFKTTSGFVELSPEQMQGIALTVAAHVQASFAVEAAVVAAIEAGEITTTEQIDAYAWPGGAP